LSIVESILRSGSAGSASEVAFIDPGVADLDDLLHGLRAGVQPILLDPVGDPIQQMADALAGLGSLSAIHIIAHGAPGEISFSAGPLSMETILARQAELARIGEALGLSGELLVWSCDTGKGTSGDRFLEALCWATGAPVAAATGSVGAATRGGRWELNARLGAASVLVPLTTAGIAAYQGLMTAFTWIGPSGTTAKPKTGTWDSSTTTNWSPNGIPASGDTVTLGSGAGAANYTVTLGANASVSSLTINAAVTATLAVGANTLTVGSTGSGAITLSGATDKITLAGGTITDAGGVSLGTGSITGFGTLNVSGTYSGTGTLSASGGTLDVFGTISSGVVLSIATTSASDLKIEGTATSAAAISITNANQTLEIGPSGNLTISAAQAVSLGKIKMSGGTLTDSSGLNIGSAANSGTLTGFGTVVANVTKSGTGTTNTITASGGTLEINGTITSLNSLTVGSGSTDTLKLDKTSTATALTFSGSTGTLELNTAAMLTLTNALAVGANTVKLDGAGTTQLTDAAGLTIAGGTISGTGTISATTAVSGSGTLSIPISNNSTITASGGTLNLTGTVTSGTFSIATGSASVLEFSGTAAINAITINNANQTLQVGSGGSLTITGAQTVSAGKLQMSGGTLTDSSGVTIGTSGTLTGYGTVNPAITGPSSGTGTITAAGGTLEVKSTVSLGVGTLALTVGSGASDKLLLDGTSAATSLSFSGSTGTLEVNTGGALTLSSTLSVGANTVKLDASGTTQLTDAAGLTIAGGTISGTGTVAASTSITGSGTVSIPISNATTVKASSGTLTLSGTVSSGAALQIDTTANSRLKFTGTATSAAAIAINNANQTLEVGSGGALTINAAESITNGSIVMSGGTLNDASGITVGSGATLSGQGTVTAAVSGAGTITASGGTLTLSGTVSSGPTFTIATGSASDLKFTGTATSAAAITISNANQTLEVGTGGNLTINAAESITNGTIVLSGGTLNDASGITVGSGATLSGQGTVTANLSGGGTVTASGGTLTLSGTVTSGPTFTIATGSVSDLKFTGTATAASAITINNANQTLEVGTGGTLTINAAESITNGSIVMSGGTLNDSSGITVGSGATLSGQGTVTAALSGSGTVTASGGTLTLSGTVSSGPTFTIATGSASDLKFTGTATAASAVTINNANQTLEVGTGGNLTIAAAQTVSLGKIQMSGGTLTDASGITLGSGANSGTLTGFGSISANVGKGGTGTSNTVAASGGALEITGSVTSIDSLTVGTGGTDKLKLDAASTATALTFSGSSGTLELNTSGTLTLTNALSIGANTVKLDGASSQLTDNAGISLSSGTITGPGKVTGAITATGAAMITASGGTLEIASAISNSGSLALTIGSGASDKLLLDASSAATSLSFSGSTGVLELNTSGTLTLTNPLSIGANTVKLDGASSQLTDNAGISLSTGTITGLGKVTGAITATGAATITASGGTLEIASAIGNSGSLALTVGSGASDKLLLDAGSAATSLSFSGSTGTLELNTSGTLTLTNALSVGANTVKLDGSGSQLTDNAGISLSTGTIIGLGKVTGAITTTGAAHITASGGTLEIASAISNSGSLALTVGGGASDKLLLDAGSAATSLTFSGSTGTLELNTSGSLTLTNALSIGANTVKLDGAGSQLTDNAGISLSTGTITGLGRVSGAITSTDAAHITASSGTLEIASAITDSGNALILTIAGASDKLLLDGVTTAAAVSFGSSGTLELNTNATLTTGSAVIGAGAVKLDGSNSQLIYNGIDEIDISGGTVTGAGKVTGAIFASGAAHITATGGVLEIASAISNFGSLALTVGSGTNDKLLLDAASAATSLTFSGSTGTLELNTSGSLTLINALSIGANAVTLDGSGVQLTDAAGVTLAGGSISGTGTLSSSTNVTGSGLLGISFTTGTNTITASGGVLDVTGSVTTSQTLAIGASSTLKLDHGGITVGAIANLSGGKTLEIAQSATISGTQTVAGGTLAIDSGVTLTDTSGITLSGGTITGAGTVAAAIAGSGTTTIAATGGTLEVTGAVSDSGNALTLTVAGNSDKLLLDAASAAHAVNFNGGSGTLEISGAASLTVGTAMTVGSGSVKLDGASSTLTDGSGVTLGGGSLLGRGIVNADLSGTGTVTASGGTLDLTGTVNSGLTLAIADVANSVLKIDGNATTGAITLDTANKTLEIGVSGKSLTLTLQETMTAGKIQLDGGTLSDGQGFQIDGGTLTGHGTVTGGTINGAGTIEAAGGTLDLSGTDIGSSATDIEIANDGSTLVVDTVASGATVSFLGGSGTLKVLHVGDFLGTIDGLVAANDTTPLNGVDLADSGPITRTQISGNTITVYNGNTVVTTLTLAAAPGAGIHADWVSDGSGGGEIFLSSVACFCTGTRILTDRGEVAVEELAIGDFAVTLSGIAKPIKWIGRRGYPDGVIGDRKILPIRVAADALGPDRPCRDLYLSPEHALYIDGVLVPAGELVNGRSIVQLESVNRLEYFHIELEDHDVIYADGAPAETFADCDNRAMFANAGEFSMLYPNDRRTAWNFCAPRVAFGSEEPGAIRETLLARAEALGYQLTEDPDLHLIADGKVVRAHATAKNVYRFAIPAGAETVWLCSRIAVPAELAATSRDRRRLGVSIAQLKLHDEYISFAVDHTYPEFTEGFHKAERGHRWTNGRALLPQALLKPFVGAVTLEAQVHRSPLGYPQDPTAYHSAVAA
jgi:hypothetical protein